MSVATSRGSQGRVAIAGASGFVGRALVRALAPSREVIALARETQGRDAFPGVEWRSCDLFNLRDAERALAAAEVAVYLVHSMMPSARLTQGRFEDLDLICADNFARAAASSGVESIVYLGGLIPRSNAALSRHLASRLEVEHALGSHGVPVTTLRAGLVIGAGGSSFEMMSRLVGRLPFMIGPRWTRSRSQGIALADVLALLQFAIEHPGLAGRAYDIACPDVVSYADMLRMTGAAQGKHTRVLTLPVRTVKLSLLWVSAITGAPQSLVRPLVESLAHDMVASDGLVLQRQAGLEPIPLREALERAVKEDATLARRPAARHAPRRSTIPSVCSVQRLRVHPGRTANWVAEEYVRWLPGFVRPFLRVDVDENENYGLFLWPVRPPLLVLTFSTDRSSPDRQLFYVTAGLLARLPASTGPRPRLEFRAVLDGTFVLAAVHDFVPRLPWFIYKFTQALVHLRVMQGFAKHLQRDIVT